MEASTATDMSDSLYQEESMLNRACWIMLHDRQKYNDRNLGNVDYRQIHEVRFMADGVEREMEINGRKVKVTVMDMVTGLDVSGYNPDKQFYAYTNQMFNDSKGREDLEIFRNCLLDYVDTDDNIRLNGMEAADYVALGEPNLPRNRPMQFREELLWIPDAVKLFPPDGYGLLSSCRVIAPQGMATNFGKPNLFSAPPQVIKMFCLLTDLELEKTLAALKKWKTDRIPLKDSLDPTLLTKIQAQMSLSESGYYTFILRAQSDDSCPARTLIASVSITVVLPTDGLRFYQYQIF